MHARLATVTWVGGPEDGEVEHRVVERDRDQLGGLELQRAPELVTRHRRHLDLTHDDTRARETEAHGDLLQSDFGAQARDRVGHCGVVGDFAFAHDLAAQRDLPEQVEARRFTRTHLGHGHRIGADVESDQAAGHASPPRVLLDSRYASRSLVRIRKCLPTRIAGNASQRMSR